MQIVSNRDNEHEMSNVVFWENKIKYFDSRLLKILPRVLSIKIDIINMSGNPELPYSCLYHRIIEQNKKLLTQTMLWANSADNILKYFSYFS